MKLIDFPKILHRNVEYFDLVHMFKPNLDVFLKFYLPFPVPNFCFCPFLSIFSVLILLLPFAFHILSGCPLTMLVEILCIRLVGNGDMRYKMRPLYSLKM